MILHAADMCLQLLQKQHEVADECNKQLEVQSTIQLLFKYGMQYGLTEQQVAEYINWVQIGHWIYFLVKDREDVKAAVFQARKHKIIGEKNVRELNLWKLFITHPSLTIIENLLIEKLKRHQRFSDDGYIVVFENYRKWRHALETSHTRLTNKALDDGLILPEDTMAKKRDIDKHLNIYRRRVFNYTFRSTIKDDRVAYLQTVVILKMLFRIWPGLKELMLEIADSKEVDQSDDMDEKDESNVNMMC